MGLQWILLLEFFISCGLSSGEKGSCPRQVHYLPDMQGKRLDKHVIRSIGVESASGCEIECFLEEFCVSYNLGPFQHGSHVCELSNSDAIRHPLDLVPDPSYNYRETVNACTSSPCPSKASCSSLSKTNYRCVCPVGYTGIDCETDVGKCDSHPCDSSANCINIPGSYKCTCQPGFAGDGFKCTAYHLVGCFVDKRERAIPYSGRTFSGPSAIDECAAIAVSEGNRAFGVQYGGQCFTGRRAHETYKVYGKAYDNQCKNGLGGSWRNNVYLFK